MAEIKRKIKLLITQRKYLCKGMGIIEKWIPSEALLQAVKLSND